VGRRIDVLAISQLLNKNRDVLTFFWQIFAIRKLSLPLVFGV
jgi:hypothetical protein